MTEKTEELRIVENIKTSTNNDEIKRINIAKRNNAIQQANALNLKCVPLKANQQLIEKYKTEQIENQKLRREYIEKASGKEPIPKDWTNPTEIEKYNKNLINFYFEDNKANEYGNLGLLLWYNHLLCIDLDTKFADQIKLLWESYFEGVQKDADHILVNKNAKKITKMFQMLQYCPVMRSSSNHLQFLIPLQKNITGMERKQITLEDKEIIEFLCNNKQTVIPPSVCSKIRYKETGEETIIYENFERSWLDQRDLTALNYFKKDSEKASVSDIERFIEFCNQTLIYDLEIKERLTKEEQEEESFYDFEAELIEILQRCFQKGYVDGNHHNFILHLSLLLKYNSVYIDNALDLFKKVCLNNQEILTENSIKTVKEVYKRYDRYSQKELIALLGDELFAELRECLKSANLNNVNCLLKSKYGDKLVTLFYDKITLKYNDRVPIPLYSFNNLDLIAKYEYQNDVIYKINIDGKTLDKNKPYPMFFHLY